MSEGSKQQFPKASGKIRHLPATEERQYMIDGDYEVYEKEGAPTGALAFHCHNFYEILYVLEGEYASLVSNQTYHLKRGDFLLIDQNVMHKYQPTESIGANSRRIILWVSPGYLRELSGSDMELSDCFHLGEARAWHFPVYYEEMLRGYLLRIAMDGELQGIRRVMDRGYLTLFFAHLNMLCNREESLLSGESISEHPLVHQVQAYIEDHMGEMISLDQLAGQVHMSKYHFLRKFKELTGVTVHEHIMNQKLSRACELLLSGAGITKAYQSTGFTEYSSFLRNFKRAFGISPGQYAKQNS